MLYGELGTHRLMIRDSARTDAFRRGIQAAVRPGDVVLDVGAGTGILALLAARAGARRVYAVERTATAEVARRLAAHNGVADVVRVIRGPLERVHVPEPVDVLVSEWMGTIGVDENLLGMVLRARDRFLRPGGRIVPERVSAWMAPAQVPMRPDLDFFRRRPYGLELSPLSEPSVHHLLLYRRRVGPRDLRATQQCLWTTEVRSAPAEQAALPARAALEFTARRRVRVNCLAAWFRAELAPGVTLENSPAAPDTHWGQLTLPLRAELELEPGQVLAVRVACIPGGEERTDLAWSVRAGDGAWEHHDTRVLSPAPGPGAPAAPPAADGTHGAASRAHTATGGRSPMGATLRRFLAGLAVDHELLREFIQRPQEVLARADLTPEEREALVSRDEHRIQLSMLNGAAPAAAPPAPQGRAWRPWARHAPGRTS